MMTAHELDDVIAKVAHDLTSTETAGFGARVRRRLDTPARRSFVPAIAGALATAAAMALVAELTSLPAVDVPDVLPPARTMTAELNETGRVPSAESRAPILAPIPVAARRAPAPQIPAGRLAWLARAVPALTPAEPLELTPLQAGGIRITDLGIEPLGTAGAAKDVKQDSPIK
jgi:hypothetical protein